MTKPYFYFPLSISSLRNSVHLFAFVSIHLYLLSLLLNCILHISLMFATIYSLFSYNSTTSFHFPIYFIREALDIYNGCIGNWWKRVQRAIIILFEKLYLLLFLRLKRGLGPKYSVARDL